MGISWVFPTSYCQCHIFVSAGSVAAFEDIGNSESDVDCNFNFNMNVKKNSIDISMFYEESIL